MATAPETSQTAQDKHGGKHAFVQGVHGRISRIEDR